MKVTRAQAQENRARIVATASTLFRERGYDGIGLAELMAASGFTHGGFYNHFGSKVDLMAEATACSLAETAARSRGADLATFLDLYLSRQHRDARGEGCTLAALGGDAARQTDAVKGPVADGIEHLLRVFAESAEASGAPITRETLIDLLARAVGAVVLSRACPDDSPLADEVLAVCRAASQASLSPRSRPRSRRGR